MLLNRRVNIAAAAEVACLLGTGLVQARHQQKHTSALQRSYTPTQHGNMGEERGLSSGRRLSQVADEAEADLRQDISLDTHVDRNERGASSCIAS